MDDVQIETQEDFCTTHNQHPDLCNIQEGHCGITSISTLVVSVWIVGSYTDLSGPAGWKAGWKAGWSLEGVYTSRAAAVASAQDGWWIAKIPLNQQIGEPGVVSEFPDFEQL